MKKIAYQGIKGAYSYEACKKVCPDCETIECNSFEEVVDKVQKGEADFGMLAVANSSAFRVANVHNLFPNMELHVVKEYIHPVNHCLLGTPDSELSDIKEVYSHPQALMQCTKSCKKLGLKQNAYTDTSLSAKYVAEEKDKSKASIASKLAGELHGLKILKENFQDVDDNRTTFWVVGKELCLPPKSEKNITTFLLTTNHIVAALYKVLGGFATNGINLTKIESYTNVKEADFLISIEGHIDDDNVKSALEEISFFTKRIKIIGVYDRG